MRNVVVELSLGRMIDRLARVIGWSPVGRRLTLVDAEGPGADRLNNRSVQVVSLEGDDMIAEKISANGAGSGFQPTICLTPRHRGWTVRSLMLVSIEAVAQEIGRGGEREPIATVTVKLERAAK